MREELSQIDLSPIADLVRIKREEELLAGRLATMESRKEKVSAVVYQRVRRDYETRKAALEAESRPLKERARHEYARLQVLSAEAEKAVEDASLEKEELEFRRELGEFPDEQFRERLAASEKRLAERRAELEAVVETKATFVNAFHSEEELERPDAGASQPYPPPATRGAAPLEMAHVAPPTVSPPIPPPIPAPFPPPAADSGSRGRAAAMAYAPVQPTEATVLEPRGERPAFGDATALEPGPEPPGVPPPPPVIVEAPGATAVLAMPRLVMMEDDKPGTEHVLKVGITVLGRSPRSDIQLPFSEVSRKHAEVVWEADGYIILDLGSENGIFVNGQRAKKQVLANGDVIQIGPQKLVFRA